MDLVSSLRRFEEIQRQHEQGEEEKKGYANTTRRQIISNAIRMPPGGKSPSNAPRTKRRGGGKSGKEEGEGEEVRDSRGAAEEPATDTIQNLKSYAQSI